MSGFFSFDDNSKEPVVDCISLEKATLDVSIRLNPTKGAIDFAPTAWLYPTDVELMIDLGHFELFFQEIFYFNVKTIDDYIFIGQKVLNRG